MALNLILIEPYKSAVHSFQDAAHFFSASTARTPADPRVQRISIVIGQTRLLNFNFATRLFLLGEGLKYLVIALLKLIPIINVLFHKIFKSYNCPSNAIKAASTYENSPLKNFSTNAQAKIQSYSISAVEAISSVNSDTQAEFNLIIELTNQEITKENGFARFVDSSQPCKDRYEKFRPYRHNYFGNNKGEHYLSACKIKTVQQAYVATQAPIYNEANLADTVADFFSAILKSCSSTIVTLVMPTEDGKVKSAHYWSQANLPLQLEDGTVIKFGGETVVKMSSVSSGNQQQRIMKRTFIAKKANEPARVLTQFHYENWPDYGIPKDDLYNDFVKVVNNHQDTKGAIFVHCHAGVGRTGTFIATHSLEKKISAALKEGKTLKDIQINFVQHILELRTQRGNDFVSTKKQYDFFKHYIRQRFALKQ